MKYSTYSFRPAPWIHLNDQLVVTEAEFWSGVRDKKPPDRGQDDDTPANSLPPRAGALTAPGAPQHAGAVRFGEGSPQEVAARVAGDARPRWVASAVSSSGWVWAASSAITCAS